MLVRSYYAKIGVEEDYFFNLFMFFFLKMERYESRGLDLGVVISTDYSTYLII